MYYYKHLIKQNDLFISPIKSISFILLLADLYMLLIRSSHEFSFVSLNAWLNVRFAISSKNDFIVWFLMTPLIFLSLNTNGLAFERCCTHNAQHPHFVQRQCYYNQRVTSNNKFIWEKNNANSLPWKYPNWFLLQYFQLNRTLKSAECVLVVRVY